MSVLPHVNQRIVQPVSSKIVADLLGMFKINGLGRVGIAETLLEGVRDGVKYVRMAMND